jgi:hypothetical protein
VALAELGVRVAPVALELVQVAAVPELDQAAVRRRTKSAIAAHHRGQVPVRAAVDLAAVVETTHEPAVTEVVVAWAVAE